ncbi:MAG: hypothetical protein LUG18_03475, partial [Candidatus Azobacteroides sp.]|nr:hypothetical protein [Candidatus Azobacteroides sp.]
LMQTYEGSTFDFVKGEGFDDKQQGNPSVFIILCTTLPLFVPNRYFPSGKGRVGFNNNPLLISSPKRYRV